MSASNCSSGVMARTGGTAGAGAGAAAGGGAGGAGGGLTTGGGGCGLIVPVPNITVWGPSLRSEEHTSELQSH